MNFARDRGARQSLNNFWTSHRVVLGVAGKCVAGVLWNRFVLRRSVKMLFGNRKLPSIEAGHYKNTAAAATEVMPVPESVSISMSENIGAPCNPLVKKGALLL